MITKSKSLTVGVLAAASLAFTGGAAFAADSPTLFAQVDSVDVTTFGPVSTPLIISTEDVTADDSTGCIVRYAHTNETPAPADYEELTDVGGLATTSFSEFTKTYTWGEAGAPTATYDGSYITFSFYQDETCGSTDTETWISGLGAATSEVTFTIDSTETSTPTIEAPGAPGTVTVSDINANNAKVTWTAPDSGGDVENYVVVVGDDTVGTFGSTILTASLAGLTPDKDYTVTVKATNDGGEATKSASFETRAATKDAELELAAETGDTLAGTKSTITATGLKPGEDYTIVLRSDPVTLASGTVASNGNLTQEVTLPADLTEGSHSITLTSEYWDGTALSSVIYFEVTADGALGEVTTTAPELADTGLALILPVVLASVLAAVGLGFILNGARKRATVKA